MSPINEITRHYKIIIELVKTAFSEAQSIGINNLLQPGLVKEMIISDALGHTLITTKRDADAHKTGNPTIKYEYLSCKEGGMGQLDRMFKSPPENRTQSLERIKRNHSIFFAVFDKNDQIKILRIYEILPSVLIAETERKLDNSKNDISHVGFSEKWARENGKRVFVNSD
ncbi:MAG: hypothetical protein WCT23_09390 [Candidatus Neomarinimicrobiota bacterium]|nr:hypothetical protein [Candidatus Cloacimonadota bacterium]